MKPLRITVDSRELDHYIEWYKRDGHALISMNQNGTGFDLVFKGLED